MPRKGFKSVTLTEKTYDLVIDCANRLNLSVPDTIKHLAEGYLVKIGVLQADKLQTGGSQ